MRTPLLVAALTAAFALPGAAPALAGPEVPSLPKDECELQALLGVENVKECEPHS